jgi:hypothetical protein
MAARITERVAGLHLALIRAECGGKTVLRSDVETLLMERWGVGLSTARLYIDTGRSLQLWTPTGDGRGPKGDLPRVIVSGPPGLLINAKN